MAYSFAAHIAITLPCDNSDGQSVSQINKQTDMQTDKLIIKLMKASRVGAFDIIVIFVIIVLNKTIYSLTVW